MPAFVPFTLPPAAAAPPRPRAAVRPHPTRRGRLPCPPCPPTPTSSSTSTTTAAAAYASSSQAPYQNPAPHGEPVDVVLVGRVGNDPLLRQGPTWRLARLRLSVPRALAPSWALRNSGDGGAWFSVVAWGGWAEVVHDRCPRGTRVVVKGVYQEESWTDRRTGQRVSAYNVRASYVECLDNVEVDWNGPTADPATLGFGQPTGTDAPQSPYPASSPTQPRGYDQQHRARPYANAPDTQPIFSDFQPDIARNQDPPAPAPSTSNRAAFTPASPRPPAFYSDATRASQNSQHTQHTPGETDSQRQRGYSPTPRDRSAAPPPPPSPSYSTSASPYATQNAPPQVVATPAQNTDTEPAWQPGLVSPQPPSKWSDARDHLSGSYDALAQDGSAASLGQSTPIETPTTPPSSVAESLRESPPPPVSEVTVPGEDGVPKLKVHEEFFVSSMPPAPPPPDPTGGFDEDLEEMDEEDDVDDEDDHEDQVTLNTADTTPSLQADEGRADTQSAATVNDHDQPDTGGPRGGALPRRARDTPATLKGERLAPF